MDVDKIGKFIIDLRKKNNLTQQNLANKLGVTYQAVSKWENGKSIPDIAILKRISEEFNVSIDELLDGKKNNKKINYKKYILIVLGIIILIISIILIIKNTGNYEFKGLYTNNKEFSVNGVMAYSKEKSSIYISNINYNKEDLNEYKVLQCTLYQEHNNTETKISTCGNLEENTDNLTTLNELLKNVTFKIDNYEDKCKNLTTDHLFIEINAKNKDNQIITHKIPLKLQGSCNN